TINGAVCGKLVIFAGDYSKPSEDAAKTHYEPAKLPLVLAKNAPVTCFIAPKKLNSTPTEADAGKNLSKDAKTNYITWQEGFTSEKGDFWVELSKNGELIGTYENVATALTAIESLKDKTADYVVEIKGFDSQKSAESDKNRLYIEDFKSNGKLVNPTMPSNAKSITFLADKDIRHDNSVTVYNVYKILNIAGNLKLNCDVILDGVCFMSNALEVSYDRGAVGDAVNLNLGSYTHTVIKTRKRHTAYKSITGDAVTGKSKFVLKGDDSEIEVDGNIDKVGQLYMDGMYSSIMTFGKVNVGELKVDTARYMETKNPCLFAEGNYTEKNGIIVGWTPWMTINGKVSVNEHQKLDIGLSNYTYDDTRISETLWKNGFMMANAKYMATSDVYVPKDKADRFFVFKSQGKIYATKDKPAYYLSYKEGSATKTSAFRSLQDVFAEINTIGETANPLDYTLTVYNPENQAVFIDENNGIVGFNGVNPTAFSMTAGNKIKSLTVQSGNVNEKGEAQPATIYYTGTTVNLTGPKVKLSNVRFSRVEAKGKGYIFSILKSNTMPAAANVKFNGVDLTIDSGIPVVTANPDEVLFEDMMFDSGVNYQGNASSKLRFEDKETQIIGTITGVGEVYVNEGQYLGVVEIPKNIAGTSWSKTTLSGGTLFNKGEVQVGMFGSKIRDNAFSFNKVESKGYIMVLGNLNAKDMILQDASAAYNVIATGALNITNLLELQTSKCTFFTCAKAANSKVPGLNITGKVTRTSEDKTFEVEVFGYYDGTNEAGLSDLELDKNGGVLFTMGKNDLKPEMVTVSADNFSSGTSANAKKKYSASNTAGYIVYKNGNNMCMMPGSNANVAVFKGITNQTTMPTQAPLGYFKDYASAVTAINEWNDSTAEYTIWLIHELGKNENLSLTTPSKAKTVQITSADKKAFYFTNNPTVSCNTILGNVDFKRVTSTKKAGSDRTSATNGSISLGKFELTISKNAKLDSFKLASISGAGVTSASNLIVEGITLDPGKLTNVGNVTLNKDSKLVLRQASTVGNVTLRGGNAYLDLYPAIKRKNDKITSISTLLTISGSLEKTDSSDLIWSLKEGGVTLKAMDFAQPYIDSGIKVFNAPKIATNALISEDLKIEDNRAFFKVGGFITYTYSFPTDQSNPVTLSYTQANDEQRCVSCFKSFNEAVKEINTLGKIAKDQNYQIMLFREECGTDANKDKYIALTLPTVAGTTLEIGNSIINLKISGPIKPAKNTTVYFSCKTLTDVKSKTGSVTADLSAAGSKIIIGNTTQIGGTSGQNTFAEVKGVGELQVPDDKALLCEGNFKAGTLSFNRVGATSDATNKTVSFTGNKAINIGTIKGSGSSDRNLSITTTRLQKGKTGATTSQLTVTGNVKNFKSIQLDLRNAAGNPCTDTIGLATSSNPADTATIATMPAVELGRVSVMNKPSDAYLAKLSGKLCFVNENVSNWKFTVQEYEYYGTTPITHTPNLVSSEKYQSFEAAVAGINARPDSAEHIYYIIIDQTSVEVPTLTLPKKVKSLAVVASSGKQCVIKTKTKTLNLAYDMLLANADIVCTAANAITINAGSTYFTWSFKGDSVQKKNFSGSAASIIDIRRTSTETNVTDRTTMLNNAVNIGSIKSSGTVVFGLGGSYKADCITGAKELILGDSSTYGSKVFSNGDVKVGKLTVKFGSNNLLSTAVAGNTAGTGKLDIGSISIAYGKKLTLEGKQDKKASPMINITGKVETDSSNPVKVALYYNNGKSMARLTNNMKLMTVKDKTVTADMFVPVYGDSTNTNMGPKNSAYGLVRSGNDVVYTKK
ncbi:MAG: hypothetical protein HUJ70_12060, partial [Pseudobutyrivibrio sp.]|nr:hypothetical protein [Pseudobutyrivibrio sp.]